MLSSYALTKTTPVYYDVERKSIGRYPSNSNLLMKGSDNSLYFGMKDNSKSIPNSYKYEDVTVVFFFGALQKFTQDRRTNWTISSRPQNYRKEPDTPQES